MVWRARRATGNDLMSRLAGWVAKRARNTGGIQGRGCAIAGMKPGASAESADHSVKMANLRACNAITTVDWESYGSAEEQFRYET